MWTERVASAGVKLIPMNMNDVKSNFTFSVFHSRKLCQRDCEEEYRKA